MSEYIDGFAFPIPIDKIDNYRALSKSVAAIWREHGALDYREYIGDDMHLEGTLSFTENISASKDEVVVFGWVTFESKQSRDMINKKVAADLRVTELMVKSNSGFDASRMVYGGFKAFI